jgi:signal transduction histidine kinase
LAQVAQDLAVTAAPVRLERVLARVADALGFEIVLHYQPLEPSSRLTLVVATGIAPGVQRCRHEIGLGDFPCGVVALRRERLVLEEPPLDAAFDLEAAGIRRYVGVPLLMGGVLLGTLAFATGERRRIRATELELVDAFASQLACRLASLRRERRLERACAALGTANRRKDEFLAVLAHELRNPLAPIRTAVETLKLTSSEPKVRRASDIIDRQVTHLAGLVDDLFEAACIHRGKLGLTRTHIDLNDVVRDAVEACRPLLAAAAHELVVALPQEPCVVAGDFRRLTQVVSNLLRNAAKFTPPRGRIEVVLAREGGSLVLRVRDNGRGMDAATRAHVFEMFYQGTRDGDRSGAGLGIGLALVKSFVTLHGGRVDAVSEGRGCGSELIVTLPSIGAALPAAPPIAGPRNEPRRKGARRVGGAERPEERRYDAS